MVTTQQAGDGYVFKGGYPTAHTIRHAYYEADLNRAVQTYRYFYPTVSMSAIWKGTERGRAGDSLSAELPLDLSDGPWIIEVPAGPLIGVINDLHQRFVADIGLTGPDGGRGGMHLVLPPAFEGPVPAGYYTSRSSTNRVLLMARAIPTDDRGRAAGAIMRAIRVHPINARSDVPIPAWRALGDEPVVGATMQFESTMRFWTELHAVIDDEPPREADRAYYGELAALGIVKGQAFAPDARMAKILADAARIGSAQMRVQSFADRRPDRVVWMNRQWEWATHRFEDGTFDAPSYVDLEAREKWSYQAQIESPAVCRRSPGAGSVYWLTTHDRAGLYLDGVKRYRLSIPLRVPASLFWSITVYDAETRAEIRTRQHRSALRSTHELRGLEQPGIVDLYFGPRPPAGGEGRWIETIPGRGWFAYFRIYGPEGSALDGSWRPGDFEVVR